MAKAIVTCTCKTCGASFTKTASKSSRREADQWEQWAAANYDQCSDCWAKENEVKKADKRAETHDIVEVHYRDYKNIYSDCETVKDSYNPETKTIKIYLEKGDAEAEVLADEIIASEGKEYTEEEKAAFTAKVCETADKAGVDRETFGSLVSRKVYKKYHAKEAGYGN